VNTHDLSVIFSGTFSPLRIWRAVEIATLPLVVGVNNFHIIEPRWRRIHFLRFWLEPFHVDAEYDLALIKRAGLSPWPPKLLQNLRASRAMELAREYPGHVAAKWLGHSNKIADFTTNK
jgi:hypothetical protein